MVMVFQGTSWSYKAIKAILGPVWPSMLFNDVKWPSMLFHSPPWCSMALNDISWPPWPSMALKVPLWCSKILNFSLSTKFSNTDAY